MQHVGLCIPSDDMVHAPFAISLAALCRHTPDDIKLSIFNQRQALVCDSRNRLAGRALEAGCDWLMWLDSDVTFPADTLLRLLGHGVAMVGAEYARRAPPLDRSTGTVHSSWIGDRPPAGLTPMWVMPLGCMLTHRDLFAHLVAPPWFKVEHRPMGGVIGEDAYFCRQLPAGLGVWRDDALSLEVGHIGTHEFRLSSLVSLEAAAP